MSGSKPANRFACYMAAITFGTITKSDVIALRKAISADERRSSGYSVGSTAPRPLSDDEWERVMQALADHRPVVTGELHNSGLKLLKSKRYAKKLASVADIIADLSGFRLVGFDTDAGGTVTPVFRAYDSKGRSFPYSCRSWQSGGDGPQLESPNYY